MTVDELRAVLDGLPGHMPVIIPSPDPPGYERVQHAKVLDVAPSIQTNSNRYQKPAKVLYPAQTTEPDRPAFSNNPWVIRALRLRGNDQHHSQCGPLREQLQLLAPDVRGSPDLTNKALRAVEYFERHTRLCDPEECPTLAVSDGNITASWNSLQPLYDASMKLDLDAGTYSLLIVWLQQAPALDHFGEHGLTHDPGHRYETDGPLSGGHDGYHLSDAITLAVRFVAAHKSAQDDRPPAPPHSIAPMPHTAPDSPL